MPLARRLGAIFALWFVAFAVFAADLPRAKPESVGISSERLENIRKVLGAQVDAGVIPGYVALVARHGKVVYYESYGVQNPNTRKPMSKDSIFRIYSMTKPITSVAAMILVEEGKIKLSDPVSKYLP
ncbi:MAG TPA: serine hydrolase domain-containing protein, partial [Burkholderiales bacterium]|nr:serine hydrolase domain-containing protein [Burkholderiales bacterium]